MLGLDLSLFLLSRATEARDVEQARPNLQSENSLFSLDSRISEDAEDQDLCT